MAEIEFQPGDIIVPMSGPFMKILTESQKEHVCDNCFQPGKLSRCSGCRSMHYCGKKCQKLDWRDGHAVECKSEVFKNAEKVGTIGGATVGPQMLLQLLRAVAKFHLNPHSFSEKHLVYDGSKRAFNDMMSHVDSISGHPPTSRFLQNVFSLLKKCDSVFSGIDFDELFLRRMFGIWNTNAYGIMNEDETDLIGSGLYIAHSVVDHSCRPNAEFRASKEKLEIRCIHPIRKGEKPVICYLAGDMALEERKMLLKIDYKFACACELCTAEESGPVIDYSQLEHVQGMYDHTSYETVTAYREIKLKLLRKLYHEYDKRITRFCTHVFYQICQLQMKFKNLPTSILQSEAVDVEQRLRITFGKESSIYNIFQKKINELEIGVFTMEK